DDLTPELVVGKRVLHLELRADDLDRTGGLRRAPRVGRVGARGDLVAVVETVLVAIDADAHAVAGRDARIRPLRAGGGLRAQLGVGVRDGELVALENTADEHPAVLAPGIDALHDDVALADRRPGDEQRGTRL